jgi:Hydantoinase/oxoprolinase
MKHAWIVGVQVQLVQRQISVSPYGVHSCGSCDQLRWLMHAGVTIQAPQLDINTVAAGGGSRLFFRRGLFQVIR